MLGPVSSQVQHDTVRTGWFTYLADQAARTANGDLAVARASSPGRDGVICRTTLRTPFPPARGRGVAPSEWTVDHGASASSSSVADTLGGGVMETGYPRPEHADHGGLDAGQGSCEEACRAMDAMPALR